MTGTAGHYKRVGKTVAAHFTVNQGDKEHVSKADVKIHTNTIECSFASFKRGMRGIYQHCDEQHLNR